MTERPPEAAGQAAVTVTSADADGRETPAVWMLAVEAPVQVAVNGTPFTVMLATPTDLDDLARGLLLTEQVIASAQVIRDVEVRTWLGETLVNVVVAPDAVQTGRLGARTVLGNSACGVCGVESLAHLQARGAAVPRPRRAVDDGAVARALNNLSAQQPLNRATRSVHAAAWCDMGGRIALVREDVGRHNALDKLVGALAARRWLDDEGFIVMSSRCSYELVYKSSVTNAQLLATISAPTTMALQWASALELPLACANGRGDDLRVIRLAPASYQEA
ncbi:formate dehydrogenase accessory sulfurtransferase FdhD [Gemmatimonas sp.]|uniref:formate dehydrogenase accessory sulfurtransferase FdhD n=1 Tax=Gemmatimonas sp. TaxID=1962908 RepID=UPI0022C6C6F0|nr:formate dehydrogenase accessory sulfurtransferase FdhD [Gemmatimonas sp.]MCA2984620.1 formate dehydrogenase accessory sulfurtransferase FdhD [Gemmatimonas sp.]MCA2987690.1 formate dehydrogenase accessory sulfurtransferase FdhD [Gemmatimonas sp.]MCA2990239.1 formate dehydrogenase accessory sulfurtransferase FdhD [Gemmatimonas sp.]MCA2996641.1 formate dehydrogenase accessory sulfurtransferase FdhD [Gemmatimonas sp.]MCE2954381.1 formate dehydrogenase accessory sulfurtransferase FdhD [Gemmatimo